MKQMKIHSVLSNNDNETTTIESLANYDEENNIFNYYEEDLNVELEVFDNKIILSRKSEDYDLVLEFIKDEKTNTIYEVKSIGLNLSLEVYTKELEIKENIIYINYELFNDKKSIGEFEFKFMFMEV